MTSKIKEGKLDRTFLVRAKKNTYASGNKPKKLEDGFEEFVYTEGDLPTGIGIVPKTLGRLAERRSFHKKENQSG